MKRIKTIYLVVAMIIVATFFYVETKSNIQDVLFDAVPQQVVIMNQTTNRPIDSSKFNKELNQFAVTHHVLIGKRVLVSDSKSNGSSYQYQTFGDGELPMNMIKVQMNEKALGNSVNLGVFYLILSGKMNAETLSQFLNKHFPLQTVVAPPSDHWRQSLIVFGDFNTLPILIILFLSFFCLSLFTKISELRDVGIRLLSGQKNLQLAFQDFSRDTIKVAISTVISFLVCSLLLFNQGFTNPTLFIFLAFSFGYIFIGFVFFSFLVSFILFIVLKRTNFITLIKGKLPTWQLIGVSIFFWGIITLILMLSLTQVKILKNEWETQAKEQKTWNTYSQYYNVNASILRTSSDYTKWWNYYNDQIKNHSGVLVDYASEFSPTRYQDILNGNYLYVSPEYLKLAKIKNAQAYQNLTKGNFGLIIPQSLSEEKAALIKEFDKELSSMTTSIATDKSIKMQAISSYTADNQSRFLFNNVNVLLNPELTQQTVQDPVLVVVTPEAMGKNSGFFWSGEMNYFYSSQNYNQLTTSLEKQGLYSEAAYIQRGSQLFNTSIRRIQTAIRLQFTDTVITAIVSLVFYILIVNLYLEHFRRDIAIKRISGVRFWEIHQPFIMGEIFIISGLTPLFSFVTKDFGLMVIVGVIQMILSMIVLAVRAHRDEKFQLLMLKGE